MHGQYFCRGFHGRGMFGLGCDRSFLTKEEKLEMLKECKDALEKEAKGIQERIKELEGK